MVSLGLFWKLERTSMFLDVLLDVLLELVVPGYLKFT